MKNRSPQLVALLLMLLFATPTAQFITVAQNGSIGMAQQKPQAESPEEKKLREREENLRKKEEERKSKEAKARATEAKKYQTLTEFA